MQVASLAELRKALRGATSGDTIELAPGEYRGPLIIDVPVTLLGLDGNTLQRGEVLLGELTLREGDSTRYLWLSGSVVEAAPPGQSFCLVSRKNRLYPSPRGLRLDGLQLSRLEGAALSGHYGYVGR